MAVFIEQGIYLHPYSTALTIEAASAALVQFDVKNMDADIAKIEALRKSPNTHHIALFGYSENPVGNDVRIKATEAGLVNLFVYPEFDEYIIAQLSHSLRVPRGTPFPRYSEGERYSLFMYDDSSTVLGRVNQLARTINIKPAGRMHYDQFERDAASYDADLYLVDLVHSETCIGVDLIGDLSKIVRGAIVAHSRIVDPKIKVACINAGACGFIEKSSNDNALLARLRTYAAIGRFKRGSQPPTPNANAFGMGLKEQS